MSFTAPTSVQTNTDGHWFALPNDQCSASGNSTYTIKAKVTFSGNKSQTKSTTLSINGLWSPAGTTDPNETMITGLPQMAADDSGTWHVTGMGTLARRVPTTSTIYVISTSQFYNKTVVHEQVHVNQWVLGPGHLYGDLIIPSDFYSQIQNITGTSQNDLITKLGAALTNYLNAQGAIYSQRIFQGEREAHAASDPIAPQYLYQICGRYGS